jgi:hypothetical protein
MSNAGRPHLWLTPDRKPVFLRMYSAGNPLDEIRQALEAMPGAPLPQNSALGTRAAMLGARRPKGQTERQVKPLPAGAQPHPVTPPEPFRCAAAALFWACALTRPGDSGLTPQERAARAPEAERILVVIEDLRRAGKLPDDVHETLTHWGDRGAPPNPANRALRDDWRTWLAGIETLEPAMRRLGVVA